MASQPSDKPNGNGATEVKLDCADIEHLSHIIKTRHSVRAYLPTPVPRELLDEALALAQTSPSNSNTQPWRLYVAGGKARASLGAALTAAASTPGSAPAIPALPEAFRHYRSELGLELYGHGFGIAREDKEARREAVLRNFDFFGAPTAMVLCMDDSLEAWDALSVGLYLQTLSLALTARGIGTCIEVSVAGYPEVCRKELGIPDNEKVLCGIAVGWPDEESEKGRSINHLKYSRDAVEKCVKFFD